MFKFKQATQSSIEERGYYLGTQEWPEGEALLEPAREEVRAGFARREQEVREKSEDEIRRLEARACTLDRETAEAGKVWQAWMAFSIVPPPFVKALLGIVAACFGIWGEARYLAPVLDGQNIPDETDQMLIALVIVVTAAILVKMAIHRLFPPRERELNARETCVEPSSNPHLRRWLPGTITTLLAAFALMLLVTLGLWRAEELIHSAAVAGQDSGLGNFLGENPGLTKLCVTLLTLALPIAAAWAMEWSFARLHTAWQWRRARRNHTRKAARLDRARKHLEAAKEKLRCQLQAIHDRCAEWAHSQEQFHRLGKRIRARRLPLWLLIFKLAAAALLLFAICALCEALIAGVVADSGLRWVILLTAWMGASGLAGVRAWRAWDRPSPRQLFRERSLIWRAEALESGAPAMAPQSRQAIGAAPERMLAASSVNGQLNGAARTASEAQHTNQGAEKICRTKSLSPFASSSWRRQSRC